MSDAGLQSLYDAHLRYMQDLAVDSGEACLIRSFSDFVSWWHELSPSVRSQFERNYQRGYTATIQDGRREIAELVFADRSGEIS